MPTMTPMRTYFQDNVLMKREQGEYYGDPMAIGERIVRMFALHDNVADPTSITLDSSFEELGLNALDMAEIFIGIEREFDLEIDEDVCESLRTLNELVEFLAKNPATKV